MAACVSNARFDALPNYQKIIMQWHSLPTGDQAKVLTFINSIQKAKEEHKESDLKVENGRSRSKSPTRKSPSASVQANRERRFKRMEEQRKKRFKQAMFQPIKISRVPIEPQPTTTSHHTVHQIAKPSIPTTVPAARPVVATSTINNRAYQPTVGPSTAKVTATTSSNDTAQVTGRPKLCGASEMFRSEKMLMNLKQNSEKRQKVITILRNSPIPSPGASSTTSPASRSPSPPHSLIPSNSTSSSARSSPTNLPVETADDVMAELMQEEDLDAILAVDLKESTANATTNIVNATTSNEDDNLIM